MKKLKLSSLFYRTLEQAIDTFGSEEAFYNEYIALQLYVWLDGKLPGNATILDIGSGHGLLARLLQILFNSLHVFGIDIDQEALEYAQKLYPTIIFKQSYNAEFPFDDTMFDVVIAHSVFHHISHQEHKNYCKEIYRVLKPEGQAVIIELNPYNLFARKIFKQNRQEQGHAMLAPYYIKKLLTQYGKTSIHYFAFFQQWFTHLRFIEPYIAKIPLGSLYAVILESSKK